MCGGSSSISLSPRSSRSSFFRFARLCGKSLIRFSRSSREVKFSNSPKSSGSTVKDMSFRLRMTKFFSRTKPEGSSDIGFELKSATWRAVKPFTFSGMSEMSFLETSSSTRLVKFWISGESRWISLSLKPSFRRLFNLKKLGGRSLGRWVPSTVDKS